MLKNSDTDQRKPKKQALGRGLDALIPAFDAEDSESRDYFLCAVERIRPNRYQPRRRFIEEDLENLSESIRAQGIIQPLLVRPSEEGYELVAGERRLRAARRIGLRQVPVVIKDVSDNEMLEMSIVENIQRENLNPMEESDAYHRLLTEFALTQESVAERVGKSRSAVANYLRLRNLPPEVKETIVDGRLSMGHARALLGVEQRGALLEIWRKVLAKGLSVRETENQVRKAGKTARPASRPAAPSESVYLQDLADDLSRQYGTKVQIRRRGKAGKVEIEFYSNEDLDRLLALLKR
jgi:ParB family chromosome partitioning protein